MSYQEKSLTQMKTISLNAPKISSRRTSSCDQINKLITLTFSRDTSVLLYTATVH